MYEFINGRSRGERMFVRLDRCPGPATIGAHTARSRCPTLARDPLIVFIRTLASDSKSSFRFASCRCLPLV